MASKADQTAKPITGGRSVVTIIGETYACPTHHHHHVLSPSASSPLSPPPWWWEKPIIQKQVVTATPHPIYLHYCSFIFLKQASKGRKELNTVLMLSVITTTTTIIINSTTTRENKRQRDANNTTLMLIVVISVFLAVELPLMVMSALHTINSRWWWLQ